MRIGRTNASAKSLFFIFLICLAAGLGSFFMWKSGMKKVNASKKWPSVSGTITESKLITKREWDKKKKKYNNTYSYKIRYQYSVNNTDYEGNRVSFGRFTSNSKYVVKSKLKEYPVNKKVNVFYNPEKPNEAVLETKAGLGLYIALIVAVMFLFGAFISGYSFVRRLLTGI
ncbi:hypothetical protein TTHT_1065 [Thermotomaculum hydrothermale]|uniref:DUF3592 domain-containing protein n=1 Tax=Thermotomaculum hydrothermale TaxID=981385 RepID=A0A7R6PN24_9BACT|nr:DUF3592 domain-containing protein [Thermotomaculum hydrothermale]BBB32603.1 hypothetical protein TTHT_1065 [Thermotomaculum hydrothermale]